MYLNSPIAWINCAFWGLIETIVVFESANHLEYKKVRLRLIETIVVFEC